MASEILKSDAPFFKAPRLLLSGKPLHDASAGNKDSGLKEAATEAVHVRQKALNGPSMIAAERERQVTQEDWSEEHDERHWQGEMIRAAIGYAMLAWARVNHDNNSYSEGPPIEWPWEDEWWKPCDEIRALTKAGALIAAEIDRVIRLHPEKAPSVLLVTDSATASDNPQNGVSAGNVSTQKALPVEAKEHELKCWPEYFTDVLDGVKTFEVRKSDRLFKVGDVLFLREWSPVSGYSGRELKRVVTYVLHGPKFGVDLGYCVMALSLKGDSGWLLMEPRHGISPKAETKTLPGEGT